MPTTAEITAQPAAGLTHIDALLSPNPGWNWLTPARNLLYYTFTLGPIDAANAARIQGPVVAFNAAQREATAAVLAEISRITGIRFQATDDVQLADLHFAAGNIIETQITGFTSTQRRWTHLDGQVLSYSAEAQVFLDNAEFASISANPTVAGGGIELLLHELGHALGLNHPFDGPVVLPGAQDNTANTLMSYTASGGPYGSYRPFDIAALMWLYGGDGLGGRLGQGTSGSYLVGTAGADTLIGGPGADVFEGLGGNDSIDGGAGLDSARWAGRLADYLVTAEGSAVTVRATAVSDGVDSLRSVERAQFADGALAFDLQGAAGRVAKFIGAVFGRAEVRNPGFVGIGLNLADGGMSPQALMSLALEARLGRGYSHEAEVRLLYTNLVGIEPPAADLAFWVGTLNSGQYTPVSLALMAAELPLNAQNIDLVGLAASGLAYQPGG